MRKKKLRYKSTEIKASPLARGKRNFYDFTVDDLRNIPSCEGQTGFEGCFDWYSEINPLPRGANLSEDLEKSIHEWIIPSREGQTLLRIKTPTSWSNHPLPRGANLFSCPSIWMPRESSPHARGRLLFGHVALVEHRFIPSCEGQTLWVTNRGTGNSIHPLLRGADVIKCLDNFVLNDSSPPARGRRHYLINLSKQCRFIPSCEGQTVVALLI